jgi:hypothetical protein
LPASNRKMISLLRDYKAEPSPSAFEDLMGYVGC